MNGQSLSFPEPVILPRLLYVPMGIVLGALVFAGSFLPMTQSFPARVALFYAGTSLAYALLPYVRRGDIPLMAAWVVLLSELAPCLTGQLMMPERVLADGLGVLMAAGPIFIARLRQICQGDVRPASRRASETLDRSV